MTTPRSSRFRVHAISGDSLQRVRRTGLDVSGTPVEHVVATGGEPLRCCLRDAEPGTDLILFGYEPLIPRSPYREIGAVYAHAVPCDGPTDALTSPLPWPGRPQVLRAYDDRGWIHAAVVHDGRDPETALAELFDDAAVVLIHSRNVAHGCFMFAVSRAG
jgi:Protein of unknown function (DUF1203)